MDFDDMTKAAEENRPSGRVEVPAMAVTRPVSTTNYYRVDGEGLWKATTDAHGVTLKRLFGQDSRFRTWDDWQLECATGRVTEVR